MQGPGELRRDRDSCRSARAFALHRKMAILGSTAKGFAASCTNGDFAWSHDCGPGLETRAWAGLATCCAPSPQWLEAPPGPAFCRPARSYSSVSGSPSCAVRPANAPVAMPDSAGHAMEPRHYLEPRIPRELPGVWHPPTHRLAARRSHPHPPPSIQTRTPLSPAHTALDACCRRLSYREGPRTGRVAAGGTTVPIHASPGRWPVWQANVCLKQGKHSF